MSKIPNYEKELIRLADDFRVSVSKTSDWINESNRKCGVRKMRDYLQYERVRQKIMKEAFGKDWK